MSIVNIKDKAQWDDLLKSHGVVILEAWATWSGPSRLMSPVFENLCTTEKYDSDKVVFVKLDIDEVSDLTSQLAIRSLPAFYSFRDGQKQEQMIGASREKLEALVRRAIDSN